MDEDTDAAREYERLRAELAEFVLEVLSERIATGKEPELSQALIDAIDEIGIADNSFVMYSTDNGPHMNSWPDAGFRSAVGLWMRLA